MPLRRRQQDPPLPQSEAFTDSDEINDEDDEDMLEGEEMMGDEVELEDEEEGEDEEEPLDSPTLAIPEIPIPPNFRDISTLASWTVSSSKPGCSIPQLRNPSNSLFWQSDGPQPHYLNIHFSKLVRIVGLRLYLNFEADESYTPTRIIFLAGSGGNDLQEWGEMRLEQPRGWIWADFSNVGDGTSSDSGSSSGSDVEEEEEEGGGGGGGLSSGHEHVTELQEAGVNDTFVTALDDTPDGNTSDFENAHPGSTTNTTTITTPQTRNPTTTTMTTRNTPTVPPHTHNPFITTPQTANTTTTTATPQTTTPLQRTHPRLPFQTLHPPSAPPNKKNRKAKTPVLRAHLVQIKILENHQNGKDTHLRGLQIFARDTEMGGDVRGSKGVEDVKMKMEKMNGERGVGGLKMERGRVGEGGVRGLGRSEWDVEGSIR